MRHTSSSFHRGRAHPQTSSLRINIVDSEFSFSLVKYHSLEIFHAIYKSFDLFLKSISVLFVSIRVFGSTQSEVRGLFQVRMRQLMY